MDESILNSVKKLLGMEEDFTAFDSDIIIHINSVFSNMYQFGASPIEGFMITDKSAKWSDFLKTTKHVNSVKSYMTLKVRLMFDPPTTSFAITAMENQVKEFEWRLNAAEWEFNPKAYDEPPSEEEDE